MLLLVIGMVVSLGVLLFKESDIKKIEHELLQGNGKIANTQLCYKLLKRLNDILMGCMGIIVFSPIMIYICIAMKICRISPIMKKNKCMGYKGRKVHFYEFNEKDKNGKYSSIGKVIGRMGLSTIPSFISVLNGELTIIGLSKLDINENIDDEYFIKLYNYEKPGLISVGDLFRIEGKNKYEVDELYLKKRSIGLDIRIMFCLISQYLIISNK